MFVKHAWWISGCQAECFDRGLCTLYFNFINQIDFAADPKVLAGARMWLLRYGGDLNG